MLRHALRIGLLALMAGLAIALSPSFGIDPRRLGLEFLPMFGLLAAWLWRVRGPRPRVLDMLAMQQQRDEDEVVLARLTWIQNALVDLRTLDMDPRQQFEIATQIVALLREIEEERAA